MSKRTDAERRAAFSAKMAWLTNLCTMATVTDAAFRILYGLVVIFRDNDSDQCHPKDETLGKACGGKSERTVSRITLALEADGILDKKKTTGASRYTFIGLDRDTPNLASHSNERHAISRQEIRHFASSESPLIGGTEPSVREPSVKEEERGLSLPNSNQKEEEEKKVATRKKTYLPANSVFSTQAEEIAAECRMDRETAARDWERFVTYHLARGSRFADWDAAWRKWCLNYNASKDPSLKDQSRTSRAFNKIRAEIDARAEVDAWQKAPAPIMITAAGRSAAENLFEGGGWYWQDASRLEQTLPQISDSAKRKEIEEKIARYRAKAAELDANAERKKAALGSD